jgi:hypothetical protein
MQPLLLLAVISETFGFQTIQPYLLTNQRHLFICQSKYDDSDEKTTNKWKLNIFNPFKEFADMFSNFDDVVDDFLFKRMGNGEVFYGKRKYKPSGRPNTEGKYDGMGMTDQARIDYARAVKEERMEKARQRRKDN